MSAGLARKLQERGCHSEQQHDTKLANIQRYDNLVTETISGAVQSQSEVIYTMAGTVSSAADKPLTSAAFWNVNENAYLMMANKVKEVGLNTVLTIVKKSGITPVMLDPVDTGLNAIMSIKRNRGALNRGMAERLPCGLCAGQIPRVNILPRRQHVCYGKTERKNLQPDIQDDIFNPSVSSTPKTNSNSDEANLLRTFPSLVATPTGSSMPAKRPDSLKLSSTVSDKNSSSGEQAEHGIDSKDGLAPADVPAVSVTTGAQWLSAGLMKHLSTLYSKSRDAVGAQLANSSDNH